MELGELVKQQRKRYGFSQAELAARAGVSESLVRRIETNGLPAAATASKVAVARAAGIQYDGLADKVIRTFDLRPGELPVSNGEQGAAREAVAQYQDEQRKKWDVLILTIYENAERLNVDPAEVAEMVNDYLWQLQPKAVAGRIGPTRLANAAKNIKSRGSVPRPEPSDPDDPDRVKKKR